MRAAYPLALALWLAAFGWRACALSRAASTLSLENARLDGAGASLDRGARVLHGLARESLGQARDAEFLQGLPNILPEDKSYLRTQRAIEADVSVLRGHVGKRLKGTVHVVVDAKANKLYVKKGLALL